MSNSIYASKRREKLFELLSKGYTGRESARILGVNERTIYRDVKVLHTDNMWMASIAKELIARTPPLKKRTRIHESSAHLAMKRHVIDWLAQQGASKIITEYCFVTENQNEDNMLTHKLTKIDIVGIFPNRKVAIEVGNCKQEKIELLKVTFNEVYHFPYGSLLPGSALTPVPCGL